jgi:hypothetical protein
VKLPSEEIKAALDHQSKHNIVKSVVKEYQEYSAGVLKMYINQFHNLPDATAQYEVEFKVESPVQGV